MNEKLTEIAIKAKVEHCVSHVRLQEFAELIIQECIFAIDEQCSNTDAEGTIEAITILGKLFGVKE